MRSHHNKNGKCEGICVFTETVGDKPERKQEWKSEGKLFSLYIFKDRKWVKIGEYCTDCGFHIHKEVLEKLFPIAGEVETTIEVEGKEVPYIYGHQYPKRFSFISQLPT